MMPSADAMECGVDSRLRLNPARCADTLPFGAVAPNFHGDTAMDTSCFPPAAVSNTWPGLLSSSGAGCSVDALRTEPFRFQWLCEDLQVRVFSYLPAADRASARRVCSQWKALLSLPVLWQHVNFDCVPHCLQTRPHHQCSRVCHLKYFKRVRDFIDFLFLHVSGKGAFKPHSIKFSFDIREPHQDWYGVVYTFISSCDTSKLTYADINWKANKHYTPSMFPEAPNDRSYRDRLRQRIFTAFFQQLVGHCTRLRTLLMPFHWSDKSLNALCRLHHLHTLVLLRYSDCTVSCLYHEAGLTAL